MKDHAERAAAQIPDERCTEEPRARFHVFSGGGYPPAMKKCVRAFQHLSCGRRSAGARVHESGLGHFKPTTLHLGKEQNLSLRSWTRLNRIATRWWRSSRKRMSARAIESAEKPRGAIFVCDR